MIDAVLSYHLNPATCGVAKFNQQLAARLGVPCLPIERASGKRHPLISLKRSEVRQEDLWCLCNWDERWRAHDLLLHDASPLALPLANAANRVYAANGEIARAVRPIRSDVVEVWCPSTLEGDATRGTIDVLLFGMAHKLVAHDSLLERLRELLTRTGRVYGVSVSTAVHEGSPWDEAFMSTERVLRDIFHDHLKLLGYLADDGLARELRTVDAVALFFDPAARANNTSLWAALDAGCPVITNCDDNSPRELIHNESVFDIDHMTAWPGSDHLRDVGRRGKVQAQTRSWDRLLEVLRAA